MSNYLREVQAGMDLLSTTKDVRFVGQAVQYKGTALYHQVKKYPSNKKIEMPVAEDFQTGFCLGLALQGYLPVSLYPRMNFGILALNQIINHLDKWSAMSGGASNPKVITKMVIGSRYPLDPGHQHKQDFTEAIASMTTNIDVKKLVIPEEIYPAYKQALCSPRSTILIEYGDLYNG